MRTYTCRGCGAPIVFIHTPGDNHIPCDPSPVAYWQQKGGSAKIVTPNGEVVSAELTGMPGGESGVGYITHFATCPKADSFRRKDNG